jgi:hypothetical protein
MNTEILKEVGHLIEEVNISAMPAAKQMKLLGKAAAKTGTNIAQAVAKPAADMTSKMTKAAAQTGTNIAQAATKPATGFLGGLKQVGSGIAKVAGSKPGLVGLGALGGAAATLGAGAALAPAAAAAAPVAAGVTPVASGVAGAGIAAGAAKTATVAAPTATGIAAKAVTAKAATPATGIAAKAVAAKAPVVAKIAKAAPKYSAADMEDLRSSVSKMSNATSNMVQDTAAARDAAHKSTQAAAKHYIRTTFK